MFGMGLLMVKKRMITSTDYIRLNRFMHICIQYLKYQLKPGKFSRGKISNEGYCLNMESWLVRADSALNSMNYSLYLE